MVGFQCQPVTIIQIQKEMDLEIRMAETGHSQRITLESGVKGDQLLHHISSAYKILVKDQLLITKIGCIIRPEEQLQRVLSDERADRTLMKDYMKDGHLSSERIPCIYLFNLKELNKSIESHESRLPAYWMNDLEEKMKAVNNLKPTQSYELISQTYSLEKVENFKRLVDKINNLRDGYIRLADQYFILKEIQLKIEEIDERCANQKKSCNPLLRSLMFLFDSRIRGPANNLQKLKDKLKTALNVDDKSFRESSDFFQSKRKVEISCLNYDQKIQNVKIKFENDTRRVKEEIKISKSKFREADELSIRFGKSNLIRILQERAKNNYQDYQKIMALFSQFIQTGEIRYSIKIESLVEQQEKNIKDNLTNEMAKAYEELRRNYYEFSEINEKNRNKIKETYHCFMKLRNEIMMTEHEIGVIEKDIRAEMTNIQKKSKKQALALEEIPYNERKDKQNLRSQQKQAFKMTTEMESQLQRRVSFNRRLNFINSFVYHMCSQEQSKRKQFVLSNKIIKSSERQFLNNTKVPTIDIDFEGTSDMEAIKSNKLSKNVQMKQQATIEEFMLYEYSKIAELKKMAQTSESSIKLKNLQEIIKRMSEIFSNIYNKKCTQLQEQTTRAKQKVEQMDLQVKGLQDILQANKLEITALTKKMQEKEDQRIFRDKERMEESRREKNRYDKLNSDFSKMRSDLMKQSQIAETLYEQALKHDQQEREFSQQLLQLKELLASKQIQIIRLEQRLKEKGKTGDKQMSNSIKFQQEADLKSMVLQNFSKKISETQNKEIEKLNQEIAILQSENEQLQEQYDLLSSEMRKIIMRETEQIEVQTDPIEETSPTKQRENHFPNETQLGKEEGILIQQEITIGQTALFMPFSSNAYIGVHHKDEERTLCNMNNLQTSNYILDIGSFHHKTGDLLSQCTFLVVLKVSNIFRQGSNYMVQGKIKHLLGFQDDSIVIKNYSSLLPVE